MKSLILPIILMNLLLTACATPEELARMRAQEQAEQQARYQAQLTATRNKCWDYGHQEGTASFANCVQTEMSAAQRDAQRQAERAQRENERRDYERREREQQEREYRAREQRQQERDNRAREPSRPTSEPRAVKNMGGCTMYEHANYGGADFHLHAGSQRESIDFFNDKASSVRVESRCTLIVYENARFQGRSRAFNADTSNLGPDWNDQVSSAKCSCR